MKSGRNDPCRCGSGRKYKKCCLSKAQEARHISQPEKEPLPSLPLDPYIEAINARWSEFKAKDYEAQIALFTNMLDEAELMDGEMAFDMLTIIYERSVERDERDRFDALVERLRERLPDVYDERSHYFLTWHIRNALATGQLEAVPALVHEMAMIAETEIDAFNNVIDMLAYHGQLSVLVQAMRLAWPSVKDSANIVPWGINEFAERTSNYIIFDHLECHSSLDPQDPKWSEQLEVYVRMDPEQFPRYMAHLTGQWESRWTMGDLEGDVFDEFTEDEKVQAPDPARQNLFFLTVEFLGYLRRQEGVPYPKGELARERILRYILNRHDGELEPRESPLEAALRPSGERRRHKPKPRRPDHPLCPDRSTLERYFVRLLNFINPQRYKVAATFELLPAWLRFLESRQLIDAQQREKTLHELQGLAIELIKVWKRYPGDPALQREMERWREKRS
ncbi:MAG: hypothetical protein DDT27_00553 [Dehalococcoidia bacterium]|nr:hypothetical protein [Chloroflexota bacterium]MBT9159878.1 hypothetical protein [Chloroflexota bacterium]MBT9162010.1 hypothetical protein [Chloroflexota bacterium]